MVIHPLEPQFDMGNNVIREIRSLVEENNISYMDAALHFIEVSGLESDVVAEILRKDELIKAKLQEEAEDLHFLKKTDRLPI